MFCGKLGSFLGRFFKNVIYINTNYDEIWTLASSNPTKKLLKICTFFGTINPKILIFLFSYNFSESDRYKRVHWQDIRVGDLVHLSNNETVPADILLLRTSDPHGICYIDTCDLDGETNLKRRQVVRGFAEKQSMFCPSKFVSRLEIDPPSTKIYRFHGAMIHPSGERVPIATESLLLRESRLKVSLN